MKLATRLRTNSEVAVTEHNGWAYVTWQTPDGPVVMAWRGPWIVSN